MSFSYNNNNNFKSESRNEWKSFDERKFRGPSQMTIGAMAGYVIPKKTYPKTDTFEFLVHKHGPGTRTHDIAATYTAIISSNVPDIKVTAEGPKIVMTGNRYHLKKVMSALIGAFKVRKANFLDTGKHKDAIIAAKEELLYLLEQDFKKEEEDIAYVPPDVPNYDTSIGKNAFSGLSIDHEDDVNQSGNANGATIEAEPVQVAANAITPEPVKLSKKQRKAQSRMQYEELKLGPSLVLGGH
jgi:hypothetical protein